MSETIATVDPAPSRRQAMLFVGSAVFTGLVISKAILPQFDAAAYVAIWRKAGNTFQTYRKGAETGWFIGNPKGMTFPEDGELEKFVPAIKRDKDWKSKVFRALEAEAVVSDI